MAVFECKRVHTSPLPQEYKLSITGIISPSIVYGLISEDSSLLGCYAVLNVSMRMEFVNVI
jgi:hypothetical protein